MQKLASAVLSTVLAGGLVVAAAPSSSAAVPIRAKALKTAADQKNKPYKKGAAGPNAYDCSGLTYYSYKKNGKTIPRVAQDQYNKATKVTANKRAKGDLVFFGPSKKKIQHVGIYAGGGKIWNANSGDYRGWKVVLAPISEYSGNVYYARYTG